MAPEVVLYAKLIYPFVSIYTSVRAWVFAPAKCNTLLIPVPAPLGILNQIPVENTLSFIRAGILLSGSSTPIPPSPTLEKAFPEYMPSGPKLDNVELPSRAIPRIVPPVP